jgi:orotate phosphoribosyltransferase
MNILKRTGAFREGHFVYPNGKHTAHYFQMPLAFRYYDTARVLAVALSRKFRVDRDIASQLPKIAIISPSSAEFPSRSAFATRSAPNRFIGPSKRTANDCSAKYVNQGEINPCIIVDDIIRSGNASKRRLS